MKVLESGGYRYLVGEEVGRGGLGEVFLGAQLGAKDFFKVVVLKFRTQFPDPEHQRITKGLFLDEARNGALSRAPNLVPALNFVEAREGHCIVMPYVSGVSLLDVWEDARKRGRLLPLGLVFAVMERVAETLSFLHEQEDLHLLHLDVSPHNIQLGFDGEVFLLDLGIALSDATRFEDKAPRGKVKFMPPEQARGEELDERADVFALGRVMLDLVSGRRCPEESASDSAFRARRGGRVPDVDKLAPHVSGPMRLLLVALLAAERAERPESMLTVLAALRALRISEHVPRWGSPEVHGYLAKFCSRRRDVERTRLLRLRDTVRRLANVSA